MPSTFLKRGRLSRRVLGVIRLPPPSAPLMGAERAAISVQGLLPVVA